MDSSSRKVRAKPQHRFDRLLDAAASVVVREGVEGVTMRNVAVEAGAPLSALYRYFANSDFLLAALRDRHEEALLAIGVGIDGTDDERWREYSIEVLIDRLMTPFIEYVTSHVDCAMLLAASKLKGDQTRFYCGQQRTLRVLNTRFPDADESEHLFFANAMNAIALGAVMFWERHGGRCDSTTAALLREMRQVLCLYLHAIEARHARKSVLATGRAD